MILFQREHPPQEIPAQAQEIFDVSGAGDTVVAVMALGLARWRQPVLAARLANLAAGIVVGKIGTAPILRSELNAALQNLPSARPEKIIALPELRLLAPRLQAQGKRLVFTNGCFDLLHWGHIKFLEESRRLGDILIVALDTDESVRRVKGPCRPVINQDQRLRMLAALEAVDYVTVFSSEQLPGILAALKPDILTKGSNYPAAEVSGREVVQDYGGQVVIIPITDPVSITGLIHQICSENN
jgi:D-beta-D-heptose 7-phosphate kinase / D-beta-D-heptose 1-phosphate adenosyltransferase